VVEEATRGARVRRLGLLAVGGALVLALAGCAGSAPGASRSQAPTASPPSATESTDREKSAPAPILHPDLTASDNLPYFDRVTGDAISDDPAAGGAVIIDALAAGGFDKSQMEVTFDRTVADLEADSIQFAVRFHGECLIGQTGPASGGHHSVVAPLLGTGTCLVGVTRQIDW
jgi:hypothetical protein